MRILFATDGSSGAERAQDFLSSLPLAPGTEILVVTVVPRSSPGTMDDTAPAESRQFDTESEEAEQWRSWAHRAAYQLAKAGVSTESVVTFGHPADEICRLAEQKRVELIVLGSTGRSALKRFLLGSVSYQVVKHALSSVLLVKRESRPIQRVMIAVDGSENSRRAAKFLRRFPLPPDVSLSAVHVLHVRPPFHGAAEGYHDVTELAGALEELRAAAEADGKALLKEVTCGLEASYRVETLLAEGPPASTLVDLAGSRDLDLLVVGNRGLTGIERFLMGSVSLQACLHAPSSVLVVR